MSIPNADAAREAARQDNGQFGTQPRTEASGVELAEPAKDAAYYWGEGKAEATSAPDGFTAPDGGVVVKTRGDQLMGGDTVWTTDLDTGELAEFKVLESIPDAGMWGTPHTYLVRDDRGREDERTFVDDEPVIAHRGDGNPDWFDEFHADGHWHWDEDADEDDEDGWL